MGKRIEQLKRIWVDAFIPIGVTFVLEVLRNQAAGMKLPGGLEVLGRKGGTVSFLATFAAGALVYYHLGTRGESRSAGRIGIYVLLSGLAAYPVAEELATSGSALDAAVRALPGCLCAGLTYLVLRLKDHVVRRRAG